MYLIFILISELINIFITFMSLAVKYEKYLYGGIELAISEQ